MLKKADIIIERFEEGITIRWNDPDGKMESRKSLCPNGAEMSFIGSEIWSDIISICDEKKNEKIKLSIEYQHIS